MHKSLKRESCTFICGTTSSAFTADRKNRMKARRRSSPQGNMTVSFIPANLNKTCRRGWMFLFRAPPDLLLSAPSVTDASAQSHARVRSFVSIQTSRGGRGRASRAAVYAGSTRGRGWRPCFPLTLPNHIWRVERTR